MKTSEKIDKIAPAFLAAQRKIKSAVRTSFNPHYKSKYADLEANFEACRTALHEQDISILQPASSVDGVVYGVETVLMHSSGQWFSDGGLMLKPAKPDPQGAGSAITYAKRYGVSSLVGVTTADDDGNAASGHGVANDVYDGGEEQQKGIQKTLTANNVPREMWHDIHENLLNKRIVELQNVIIQVKGKR